MAADDDWLEVVRNLSWVRAMWKRMKRIFSREGEELRVSGFLFKAIVQAVLLFSLENWIFTPRMVRALGGYRTRWSDG